MMNNPTPQNRQFNRIPISIPVKGKYSLKTFQNHSFEGQSLDISYDGLCIKTNANGFKAGQKLKLSAWRYKGDFPIKATGKICWTDSNNDTPGSLNIGIKLIRTRHYSLWCEIVDGMGSST